MFENPLRWTDLQGLCCSMHTYHTNIWISCIVFFFTKYVLLIIKAGTIKFWVWCLIYNNYVMGIIITYKVDRYKVCGVLTLKGGESKLVRGPWLSSSVADLLPLLSESLLLRCHHSSHTHSMWTLTPGHTNLTNSMWTLTSRYHSLSLRITISKAATPTTSSPCSHLKAQQFSS